MTPEQKKAAYIAAARKHHDEGTLEIDDLPAVTEGDDEGAYVGAWLWISNDEASIPADPDLETRVDNAVHAALEKLGLDAETCPSIAEDLNDWLTERAKPYIEQED